MLFGAVLPALQQGLRITRPVMAGTVELTEGKLLFRPQGKDQLFAFTLDGGEITADDWEIDPASIPVAMPEVHVDAKALYEAAYPVTVPMPAAETKSVEEPKTQVDLTTIPLDADMDADTAKALLMHYAHQEIIPGRSLGFGTPIADVLNFMTKNLHQLPLADVIATVTTAARRKAEVTNSNYLDALTEFFNHMGASIEQIGGTGAFSLCWPRASGEDRNCCQLCDEGCEAKATQAEAPKPDTDEDLTFKVVVTVSTELQGRDGDTISVTKRSMLESYVVIDVDEFFEEVEAAAEGLETVCKSALKLLHNSGD